MPSGFPLAWAVVGIGATLCCYLTGVDTFVPVPCHFRSSYVAAMESVVQMTAGTRVGSPARLKKEEKISTLAGLLEDATLIFSIPVSNIKCNSMVKLRKTLPDHIKPFVAKNKLMALALKGSRFEVAADMLKCENMWFFCKGDEYPSGVKAVEQWVANELGENFIVTHSAIHGVLDGQPLDSKAVSNLKTLPSKTELYKKIALGIKSMPLRVAKGVKAVPNKVALGIKLAFASEGVQSSGTTLSEEAPAVV